MKKFLSLILGIAVLFTLTLSGCSCNPTSLLVFTNAFNGGNSPEIGYTETLTYSVSYVNDQTIYPELKKASATDSVITADGINYSGILTTRLTVYSDTSAPIPEDVRSKTDIFTDEELNVETVYHFTTELNLTASYTFKDSETPITVNDTIITEAFFLPIELSFSPIYSTYKADMHDLFSSSSQPADRLKRICYDYTTIYTVDDYYMKKTSAYLDSEGEIIDEPTMKETDGGYTFRTDIDNNALLFVLRNYATTDSGTTSLSVMTPAYDGYQSILLSKHTIESQNVTLNNDSQKIDVKKLSFNANDQNASGLSHYLTIQNAASTNKALLISYAQPLFDYSSMTCLGALEFKLTNIA